MTATVTSIGSVQEEVFFYLVDTLSAASDEGLPLGVLRDHIETQYVEDLDVAVCMELIDESAYVSPQTIGDAGLPFVEDELRHWAAVALLEDALDDLEGYPTLFETISF